ncbi:Uncharacterized protein APZ42_002279, partial [Daphnia magna]
PLLRPFLLHRPDPRLHGQGAQAPGLEGRPRYPGGQRAAVPVRPEHLQRLRHHHRRLPHRRRQRAVHLRPRHGPGQAGGAVGQRAAGRHHRAADHSPHRRPRHHRRYAGDGRRAPPLERQAHRPGRHRPRQRHRRRGALPLQPHRTHPRRAGPADRQPP